jgi:hypothetical protein
LRASRTFEVRSGFIGLFALLLILKPEAGFLIRARPLHRPVARDRQSDRDGRHRVRDGAVMGALFVIAALLALSSEGRTAFPSFLAGVVVAAVAGAGRLVGVL